MKHSSEWQISTHSLTSYFKELIRARELFYFFAWRDTLVRYKQAFFGIAWALIRPMLNMLVFTFLFSKLGHFPSGNVNYPLFVLAGMLPWQLFASTAIDTCSSLINNANLVSKVYFPRLIIPTSQIIVNLVDFAITAALLLLFGLWTGNLNGWTLLTLPLFTLLAVLCCTGTSLWLSAMAVQYRDVRLIVPFFVQFGMFLSPVGYGSFVISPEWQWLYFLNPMVGIIDGFRWAFFGLSYPGITFSIVYASVITMLLLVSGFMFFRKMERSFADKI